MATRSRIGIQLKDNSVLSVYHHWDGYPEWLGRILTTHYNSREQVAELIDGGDMSSCWNDTVWGEDRTDGQKYGPEYYSARGENCPPRLDDIFEYLDKKNNEEYAYIWTVNDWKCLDMHSFDDVVEIPSGELAMIDYNDDRKELQTERMIDDFIAECEREAAKLEVTVDYYIAEFI